MKISEILNMSTAEFAAMPLADRKKIMNQVVNTGNRRIRALENLPGGKGSPAYQSKVAGITEQGAFSVKGKVTVNPETGRVQSKALNEEFNRAKYFLNLQTSTVRGYKKYLAEGKKRLQGKKHGGSMSESLANSAWESFNNIKNAKQIREGERGSYELLEILSETIGNKKYNTFGEGELERRLEAKWEELHRAEQAEAGEIEKHLIEGGFIPTENSFSFDDFFE